ncbi:MAG: hypothetical protein ACOYM3_14390 [Terrimicrobiaceae bacterium]
MFPPPGASHTLVKMFAIEKKSELEKYCSDLTITQEELVQLILWSPLIGYVHSRRHEEHQPVEARLTERDMAALRTVDPAIRAQRLPTIVNKVRNMFDVRKRVSAHLFVGRSRWHLFYFSFRDVDDDPNNHWKHGSHVHFVNDLWLHYRPELLDDLLFSERKVSISDSFHIRFKPFGENK